MCCLQTGSQLQTHPPVSGRHVQWSRRASLQGLNAAKQRNSHQVLGWVQDMLVTESLFAGLRSVTYFKGQRCNSSNSGMY